MAVFRGFAAYRPSKENQSAIPALPYDVMSSEEARRLAEDKPLSFIHIDRAEIDLPRGTDPYSGAVYERARDNLRRLEKSGALIRDSRPCFYIYRQVMNGRSQVGIAGCASIDDYMSNVIKKHEHTLPEKERDRINHVDYCDANTGPIFLTYRKNGEISDLVRYWMNSHTPVYDFMFDKVKQTVWAVDDDDTVSKLSRLFKSVESMYIADGHHRCASAVRVGQMRREANPGYTGDEEFNYFMAVAFPDSEQEIMDYNRVVKDLNGLTSDEFITKVKQFFTVDKMPGPFKPACKHTFGMLLDGDWYCLTACESVINNADPVSRLDVSILQNCIFDSILNIKNPKTDPRLDFIGGIRGLGELERRANTDMRLAFSVYPVTVADLMTVADAGLIMPPKSTWFEPKLLSGLFIHHLSD